MTPRPRAAATLLAPLASSVPPRLVKRLDQNPRAADAWTWSAQSDDVLTVTTDGGEIVRLAVSSGVVASLEGGGCTCLLSPKCFHLLAVVAALDVVDEDEREGGGTDDDEEGPPREDARGGDVVSVSDAQREAARAAGALGERLVAAGASAAGAVVQGELLRACHAARAVGLYRVAAAGTRVVRGVRALREDKPEFALGDFCADLDELLAASWAIARAGEAIDAAWVGVARRAYEPFGGLRVSGLFAEPVTAGGYAGIITYVCDERGRIFTLHDVMPAEAARARTAYDAAVKMGDASIAHRALVRRGLFMQDATASRDMRLGAGAAVKAVCAGPSAIDDIAARALWDEPLPAQLARAYAALDVPLPERPAAATLAFVRGAVVGRDAGALILDAETTDGAPLALRIVAPTDHAELSYRDNLRLLAAAPGLRVRVAGHVVHGRPRTLAGVAVIVDPASAAGARALSLPEEWGGRVCLGLDRLQGAHVAGETLERDVQLREAAPPDPLAPLRRRVQRLALGGRATLGPAAIRAAERERTALEKGHMATAAVVLGALASAASDPRGELGLAWVAASTYERVATRALGRAAWVG